ncbi:MAG: SagB family peptide dehydrogenase [Actinomycetota bacterium]|nr:SagB family peptide dehydrogenase [Actinomycetota bacterium]
MTGGGRRGKSRPMGSQPTVRTYHDQTRHGAADHSLLRPFRAMDPATRPPPFKHYVGGAPAPLPTDVGHSDVPAAAVLSGAVTAAEPALDDRLLARLLHLTAGVTRVTSSPSGTTWFRASMSAGNLHPVEVYVACGELAGVPAGVHHFAPREFGLTPLREVDARPSLAAAAADPDLARVPAALVLTGIPWRTAWKYGERGLRHLYWDAGAMLANLLAVAGAAGLPARVLTAFVDREVGRLVGVERPDEVPLAVVALGSPRGESAGVAEELPELRLPVEAPPAEPVEFPLLEAGQAAGDLHGADDVARWREAAAELGGVDAPARVDAPAGAPRDPIETVVLRRGSTRVMRHETVPAPLLTWGMAAATRHVPGDFAAPGRSLVEHGLSVHAVDGVVPGAYRWRGHGLELVRPGEMRGQAAHLCLDQPLGGDSAYTAFHLSELGGLLSAVGDRGYRAAQLEGGVVAGRLALAAFTLGFGATGLTFYDDEVSAFFNTAAACLLVTSVGVPAYRSTPGGGPGQPATLRSFDRLMLRLSSRLRK